MPPYNGVIGIEQSFRYPVGAPKYVGRGGMYELCVMSEHPFASSFQPATFCGEGPLAAISIAFVGLFPDPQTWYSCALRMLRLGAFIHKIQIWNSGCYPQKLHFAVGDCANKEGEKVWGKCQPILKKVASLPTYIKMDELCVDRNA
ncbi:hypothetical protein AVEN_1180-1 [Araneus ventricosus]|uniref:Uncharacterized protein n=1 Tax=Araneus ventricosus TaxID=182803 RepID=A0A4Y2EET7_ARAVE|nr:hypothetical protein AVEN_1180-1 [Araneus ventricosus]